MDWEITVDFPAREVNTSKRCERCDLTFRTQREAAAHVVDRHQLVEEKRRGPFIIQKVAVMPLGRRDRMLMFHTNGFYHAERLPSDWNVITFANGAAWMLERLQRGEQAEVGA